MKSLVVVALVALGGCATSGSTTTAQRFTGYPYDIKDDGSRISGLVCGMSVDYSVAQHGDVTRVNGFGGGSVFFEVRDTPGARHLTGTLNGGVGRSQLDLVLTSSELKGRAGTRDVELTAVGDSFEGRYKVLNMMGWAPMKIEGRDILEKLPAAELAALLPGMLNCEGPMGRPVIEGPVAVRFGGPPGYESRAANEIR
ncbi:MAG TPA: hypothetical protein VGL86_05675 [Polyangia bacterium]|jgi:hypothetical protein